MEQPSPAANDDLLLDLSTLTERPVIKIDGRRYEILSPDEISIIESHRFAIWGKRIEALAATTDPEEEEELRQLAETVARQVGVGVPDEVFATLTGSHKLAIVDVFTGLLWRKRLGVAGAIAKAAGVPWTGENMFPGFSASTADRQDGGWVKRLSRWFART